LGFIDVTRSLRIVQRNAVVYRRVWRGSLFASFLQPTLYLMALGFGVGSLIDPRRVPSIPGGGSYLQFLAPGLLAAACMQVGSFESSWPVTGKILWRRNYHAMLATPLAIDDLIVGELLWIAIRLTTVGTAFILVASAFGVMRIAPATLLAVLFAVLTGLAFSAPIMAYAATLKSGNNFNVVFRFIITPMFMFSGVFFPVDRLPPLVQWIAEASPLYHGVQLVRGLTLRQLQPSIAMMHLIYLLVLFTGGLVVARYTFRRKLYA
jgi:lipooligosaccharide transport system permease protein